MAPRPKEDRPSPTVPFRVVSPAQARTMIQKEMLLGLKKPYDIAQKLNLPVASVKRWMQTLHISQRGDEITDLVKQAVFQDKVPILTAIADGGLVALFEWLSQFVAKREHLDMSVKTAKELTDLIEKLHSMYQHELGKSTTNLDVMIQKTEKSISVILCNLQKPPEEGGDPFGLIGNNGVVDVTERS